jgi:hypothetical protein
LVEGLETRGLDKLMKSVNRKVLMTLIGVAIATPFLAVASLVGVHVAALADNVRTDVFFLVLAMASVAVRILNGHFAATGRTEQAERGYVKTNDNTDLRRVSTISPGY